MDKCDLLDIPGPLLKDSGAFILEGSLRENSTEKLHYHACHQLLRIRTGITLFVDEERKQPLFSNMTALIPAGAAHRSLVMGDAVHYKSIYLKRSLLNVDGNRVIIFDMSDLGVALFDRLEERGFDEDLNHQCFHLLLKLLEGELSRPSTLTRIPLPRNPENRKIISYMEKNFASALRLSDFTGVLNYSERHISRIFKEDLGISLFEYLRLYRIFRASLMLCETEPYRSVTEIAYSCGYDSLSSFYKDFRDIFSLTPREFRLRKT